MFRTNKKQRKFRLLLSVGPPRFVDINILSPLAKTKDKNEYVVIITDHYSKLTKPIPTAKTTARITAIMLIAHSLPNFGIMFKAPIDNESQLTYRFFDSLYKELRFKSVPTTEHQP